MPESTDARPVTRGHLLDGRVRHDQRAGGHRSGIEPVFLAAAVPARPGEWVLEAGTGSGAALLCLGFRIPDLRGVGVERDPAAARLAEANFRALDAARLSAVTADIGAYDGGGGHFDHVLANPPWHDAAASASPDAARDRARRAAPGLIEAWVAALARLLRHRGTLTLIAAAHAVAPFLAALPRHQLGSPALLPLWPRANTPARLVLMRAVRHGRAPLRLLPGLVLHEADGRFTPAADAVLRHGAALDWDDAQGGVRGGRVSPARSRNTPGTARAARCTAPVPRR